MPLSLTLQICGLPLFVVLSLLCVILCVVPLYLTFKVQRENLLVSFFPLTLLPILVGLSSSTLDMISSVQLQLNSESDLVIEPAFLLMMNLIPFFMGCLAAFVPVVFFVLGRAMLAWRASGLRLVPEKPVEIPQGMSDEEILHNETEDYLERLVRPR